MGHQFLDPHWLYPSQPKPIELVRPHGQQIGQIAHPREYIVAEHFNENVSLITSQIQFDGLRSARKIVDHQRGLLSQPSQVCQYPVIGWIEKLDRSAAKYSGRSAD